jgi:GAF domain-containing protein
MDELERQRLAELEKYDTGPDAGFDDFVLLARLICEAPIATVTLVGDSKQYFKAVAGLDFCDTVLDQSICRYAIRQPEMLVIPDLTKDARAQHIDIVAGEPFVRFYAGAPLRTRSGILGTVCVMDTRVRPEGLTFTQGLSLEALARQVMVHLELRRALMQATSVPD